jgi:hypothetical protein
MLTVADRALLRAHGYCWHHESSLGSVVEGEPYLQNGLLYYVDGRRLMICGYPLDRREDNLVDRVRCIAADCLSRFPIEIIRYYGPIRMSLRGICPSRFRSLGTVKPLPTDAEMLLDCRVGPSSRRLRRWMNSERSRKFSLRRRRAPNFTLEAAHYLMIEEFFSSVEIDPYLLDLAYKLPAMIVLDTVEWFEAWAEERLVGISAVIDAFEDTDLALFLTADRAVRGASDFLYGAMKEAVLEHAKRFLNLGPSSSEGHFYFKNKWGAQPQTAPYWWQSWGAGELARREYDSWPSRLLQYGLFFIAQSQLVVGTRMRR